MVGIPPVSPRAEFRPCHTGVSMSYRGVEMSLWVPLGCPWGQQKRQNAFVNAFIKEFDRKKTPQLCCERLYRRNVTRKNEKNGHVNAFSEQMELEKTKELSCKHI